ncbi:MAG: sulfotransferase [Ornithinimicrobium sp.]
MQTSRAFFVGPGKCGTSWLYAFISAHPEVSAGTSKDPGVMLHVAPDIRRYESLWSGGGLQCDFSNTYIFSDIALRNIKAHYPAARVLLTIREPVSRLISQYAFMKRNGRFSGGLAQAIEERPDIVKKCRYADYGLKWLEEIPAQQLTILNLETLRKNPSTYRKQLCEVLGVSSAVELDVPPAAKLPAAEARSAIASRLTKNMADAVRQMGGFRVIESVKRSPLPGLLYKELPATYQREFVAEVPASLRRELGEQYANLLAEARTRGVRIV